jgi:hypothetical protein
VAWLPDGKRLHLRHGVVDAIIQAQGRPRAVGSAYDAAIARAKELMLELGGGEPAAQQAALPGMVADELLQAMRKVAGLDRAFVNNAGAVALYHGEAQPFPVAALDWPGQDLLAGQVPQAWLHETKALASARLKAGGGADVVIAGAADAAQAMAAVSAITAELPARAPDALACLYARGEALWVDGGVGWVLLSLCGALRLLAPRDRKPN